MQSADIPPQTQVTISLLAEDSAPVDTWRPQQSSFMGQPSGAGMFVCDPAMQLTKPAKSLYDQQSSF
eukprot:scaffold11971_cov20-Tisochrysis_lutea.AAC.7